ncbi:MAG: hypothetical protein Kow00121_14380 [Elainellaceae cyanobacterium]
MHVVVYTDSAGVGGAEISLGHLVTTTSADTKITIVGVNSAVLEAIAKGRPQARQILLPATGINAVWKHIQTFHQLNPDIVHINLCTPWAGAIALFAALTLPKARVVRVDQLPLRTTDLVIWLRTRLLSLRVDAHVAVGQACGRHMEDFYALGRGTVLSIPNGVPDVEHPPTVTPTPLSDKTLHVGSIGRLDPMKGHDTLLQAIARVEHTKLTILGEGAYRSQLEQLAEELGIGDRVAMPGWIDNPRLYLTSFDVIAQPSRSEGFPLSIVEAMLASRPVVATKVGSVAEAITDRQTGFLVDKDDVEALTTALCKLRDNPDLRLELGQQARAIAASQFTVEYMTAQYEELWQKLVQRPRNPRLWVSRPRD